MSRLQAAAVTAAVMITLVLAAYTGIVLVAAIIVVIQAMIAASPAPADERGYSVPCPRFLPTMIAGIVAVIITVWPGILTGADGTTNLAALITNGVVAGILPGMAAGVLATLIAQMMRSDGRAHLVHTAGYTITTAVLATLTVTWVGAAQSYGGADVIVLGAIGVCAALASSAIGWRRLLGAPVACLIAAIGGGIAGWLVAPINSWNPAFGAVVAAATALFTFTGLSAGANLSQGRLRVSLGWGFPAGIAIAVAGPVVYIAGQLAGQL